MTLTFFDNLILYCLYKLNGDRTVSSVYHLLNGKKSAQTLQDIHLFGMTVFFKTYESLSREQLMSAVERLCAKQLIEEGAPQHFTVTAEGRERAENLFHNYPFLHSLDGWTHQHADVFWARLSLLVQVSANLAHHITAYVPVQKDEQIQNWLKAFLRKTSFSRRQLGKALYDELETSLERSRYTDPIILVLRLTGQHLIGYTASQAAQLLELEEACYHYQFLALLHELMDRVKTNPKTFPILAELVAGFDTRSSLTKSAQITLDFLQQGLSPEKIAALRGLKINTIHDHIVELALNIEDFDISPYIDSRTMQAILEAAKKASSKQLREIRSLAGGVDYFQIRLCMAKYGDEIGI